MFLDYQDYLISFGGYSNGRATSSVEMISIGPDNNPICHIPNLPEPVYGHSTIKTQIGVITCGGYGDKWYKGRGKCYRLASNNEWAKFPTMTQKRYYFSMQEGNNKLFAIGGGSTERSMEWIDLLQGTNWTKEDLPFRIWGYCMIKLNDSHILLTGGWLDGTVS